MKQSPDNARPSAETVERATQLLIEKIGADCVTTDEAARYRASMDNLRLSVLPHAVVHPHDEEAVSATLRLANAYRIPVTTRGAGSATTGATTPFRGGWVLDLSGWKNLHIDAEAMMAYVQPGATVGEVDAAARVHGLMYPPDPGSKAYATIGGTIACNAGGLRGAKYGVTRDYVYELEGFLPTGEFVRWGADTRKYVSGYNVRDLWIGSEGTLGVITGCVLKLVPEPPTRSTLLAGFGSESDALDAAAAIMRARIIPSVMEFLDAQTIECTERMWKKPVMTAGSGELQVRSLLLIEVDGHPDRVAEDASRIQNLITGSAIAVQTAETDEQIEELWKVRRSCSQAMFQLGDTKLNEDVVVPLRSQQDLIAYTLELRERTGLATPTFGHAADGNFHVHIMYDRGNEQHRNAAAESIQLLMEHVVRIGGVITGEHGVGLAKSPFIHLQHSAAEIAAMKAIKAALDPNGILNPGKIWDPVEVWDYPREDVRMPWDH